MRLCAVLERGQVGGDGFHGDTLRLCPLHQQRQVVNTLGAGNDFLKINMAQRQDKEREGLRLVRGVGRG